MTLEQLDEIAITLSPAMQGLLALAIVLMMFAIALRLTWESFSFLRTAPLQYWGGFAAQIVGLPLMTLILVNVINAPPTIALGMIVVAACPGGNVSNFMTYAARGDIGYSVSLTAGSSIFAAFFTPVAILFWSGLYPPTADLFDRIEFNRVQFVMQTTLLLAAPLAAGMLVGNKFKHTAERIGRPIAILGAIIMAGVIFKSLIDNWALIRDGWQLTLVPVALHNASAFALGAIVGLFLTKSMHRRRSLAFEIGIQNAALAVVLLLGQLKGFGAAAALAGVWGIWHYISGGALIAFYRFRDRQRGTP